MTEHNDPLVIMDRKQVVYSDMFDMARRYVSDTPTPSRIATLFRDVDDGDLAAACELMEEIESKDANIQAVAGRRREAITALEWSIEPADDTPEATEASDYAQEVVDTVDGWPTTLEHLATAIGPGVAASEMIWRGGRLIATNDVPSERLWQDADQVSVRTDEEFMLGLPALRGKFIVHTPHIRSKQASRVTLARATAILWVMKHHALSDWIGFSEVFGYPLRTATYGQNAPKKVKDDIATMLKHMGPDEYAVFPEGTEIKFIEAGKGTHPGEMIAAEMDKRIAILWLGQTLTTDVGDRGSFAAARVHENVKATILLNDLQQEARTIERDVLSPLVRIRWPGRNMPTPHWKRRTFETKNLDAERLTLDKVRLLREMDKPIDDAWLYEALGVPQPKSTTDQSG